MTLRVRRTIVAVVVAVFGAAVASAQQMPDPKEMAGIPRPVGDLAAGTVVVRVIKGSLANNIADQPVELSGITPARTVRTDASGRAEFSGLQPGTRVTARATVAGEQLQSQEFVVPATGGIRLLLVATDPDTAKRAEEDRQLASVPAQPGAVALGEQSRFVIELVDGSLSVFNILQVVNTARTPVQPAEPLVFDLPVGATKGTVLQDSTPLASVSGQQVAVKGPFPPGPTLVQFAYSMPYSGGDVTIEQRMPLALSRVIVLAQKTGDMRLTSAQLTEQREMTPEGQTYMVGQGPGVKAGDVLSLTLNNLPHAPLWPRNLALAVALLVLLGGAWASFRIKDVSPDKGQKRLETKRAQLFAELTSIEEQHREGRLDPSRYAAKRQELVSALERVYAEIDRQAA